MFDPFLQQLHRSLQHHGGQEIDVPIRWGECISKDGNSKIKSWLWKVPGFRRWRVTRLNAGHNLQVLNSVAYPSFKNDHPILGIDLLWFGKNKKLVAVLDFQPLIQEMNYFERYFYGLKALKNKFPDFNNDKNIKIYDPQKYFSPWVLFCKGGLEEAENLLPIVFNSFLLSYWELHEKSNELSSVLTPDKVRSLHISYDKYGLEKDPAHGLFSGFFGKDWSDAFLKQFLFNLSQD